MYMSVHSAAAISPYDLVDTSYVELYVFPDSTGPPDQWPMQSHDNLHTKNYNFVDNVTAIHSGEDVLPKNYVLKQNYPNPFNSATTIEFALPEDLRYPGAGGSAAGKRIYRSRRSQRHG
jgi:hypothetical protein